MVGLLTSGGLSGTGLYLKYGNGQEDGLILTVIAGTFFFGFLGRSYGLAKYLAEKN